MSFEVVPIQQLSLFLGDPTYTLTVTLFAPLHYVVTALTLRRISLQPRDAAI